jgi:beta-glucanase (GH16 family)
MLLTKIELFMGIFALAAGILFSPAYGASTDTTWGLVWSDECNGASGSAVDGSKWNLVNKGDGFGNNELEYYTNRTANSYYDGSGNLVIKTMKESYSGKNYTSAKLYSQNKGDWTYCKVYIRAKLPKGRCVWPAFWMMPTSSPYGGWPICGEIDIMENRGDQSSKVGSTIHFGNPWKYIGASYTLPSAQTFDTAYHNFGLEWEAGTLRFYVDNNLFETRVSSEWYCSGANQTTNPYAPFDQNFYMQLNTAVGGPNTPYKIGRAHV